jgi:ClpA/ClpB-like protein
VPSVEALSAAVEGRADGALRLATAAAMAGELHDRGDELLDRYVRLARAEQRSWTEIGAALGVTKQAVQQRFVTASAPAWPKGFDDDGRALLTTAQAHARRFRHRYLGTEHLLLALTADPGLAGTTLARLNVDPDLVNERILQTVGAGHSSQRGTLGISPRTKRVLEAAGKQARRLGSRCAAPEHVLLALSAQRDAVGAEILRSAGATDNVLRDQLADLLVGEAPELAARIRPRAPRRLRRRVRHPNAA